MDQEEALLVFAELSHKPGTLLETFRHTILSTLPNSTVGGSPLPLYNCRKLRPEKLSPFSQTTHPVPHTGRG